MVIISLLRDVGSTIKDQLTYGLVCIDIFSKKCYIILMETNDIDTVYNAVMECFRVLGQAFRTGNKLYKAIAANEGVLNSNKLQKIFKN